MGVAISSVSEKFTTCVIFRCSLLTELVRPRQVPAVENRAERLQSHPPGSQSAQIQMSQGDAPPVTKKAKVQPIKGVKKKHPRSAHGALIDLDDDSGPADSSQRELVVYNPGTSDAAAQVSPLRSSRAPSHPSRGSPSVGAFAVQCAACFKWRLVPTKEKYEEIREHLLQDPFVCERAREWRPDVSCDDPADISQDGSRLWAIDKPNIAQPPPGWERMLRIRGEGSTKFADVYAFLLIPLQLLALTFMI